LPYAWLLLGSGVWFVRSLVDLGLTRRPLLEPNLNVGGLACVTIGLLGLLIAETVLTPVRDASARNPADPNAERHAEPFRARYHIDSPEPAALIPSHAPPPSAEKRVVACAAQIALVAALLAACWSHFESVPTAFAVTACCLILPYTRIAMVDGGQLIPAASIVAAIAVFDRPLLTGALLGIAGAWMPPIFALVPLWLGFHGRAGAFRFLVGFCLILGLGMATTQLLAYFHLDMQNYGRALGARTLAEVGLLPWLVETPRAGSLWAFVDPSYRLPVLVTYGVLVAVAAFWPTRKNLGELIALSAALLVASQFWYLDEGGALVQLYMPIVVLMVFRPNLTEKRPRPRKPKTADASTLITPA
jgi:hypothetical protein